MCGILGIYYKDKNREFDTIQFNTLLETIKYRGPDSRGIFKFENFIFGMNRLSILDEKKGNQPITSLDGDYKIIFNGEIYNYRELKKELIQDNEKFKTDSDTEVVLKLYIKYGVNFLKKLNGMFAISIFKISTKELFLARDRFGKKPLYIFNNADVFMFCSELGPILKSKIQSFQINYKSIIDQLSLWYVSEPKTMVKDVFQLNPGYYLKMNINNLDIKKWWNINLDPKKITFNEATEKLEYLIEDSVKMRLTSDVKVATMLSGGIDSGIISHYYKKNFADGEAFIIDFKEKSYSEYDLGKKTSDRLNLQLNKVDYIENESQIIDVLKEMDEPLSNASLIASYQIFNFIKKSKIKVVLTGDGGDELFGGYPTYKSIYYHNIFKFIPSLVLKSIKSLVNFLPVSSDMISFEYKLKKLLKYIKHSPLTSHPKWREPININDFSGLLNFSDMDEVNNYDPYSGYKESYLRSSLLDQKNKLMFADFENFLLNDHLRKIDRSSMLNSVEARCPFLDHRIVDFAYSINSSFKVNMFELKKILKTIANKFLDKEVINSKKRGLTPPINFWINDYFKNYIYDNLDNNNILFNLFEKKIITKIFDDHFKKKKDYSRFIWSIISMSFWFEKNKAFLKL